MISGQYDPLSPVETAQRAMVALLGTPARHRRHVLFDGRHLPLIVDSPTLDWGRGGGWFKASHPDQFLQVIVI